MAEAYNGSNPRPRNSTFDISLAGSARSGGGATSDGTNGTMWFINGTTDSAVAYNPVLPAHEMPSNDIIIRQWQGGQAQVAVGDITLWFVNNLTTNMAEAYDTDTQARRSADAT